MSGTAPDLSGLLGRSPHGTLTINGETHDITSGQLTFNDRPVERAWNALRPMTCQLLSTALITGGAADLLGHLPRKSASPARPNPARLARRAKGKAQRQARRKTRKAKP